MGYWSSGESAPFKIIKASELKKSDASGLLNVTCYAGAVW